ncbi:MAG: hypothetical protein DSY77_15450 [Bacteroidetes bacterium]|nr:MAG: hypothetical protein DSY77_15450 [Bacteroidota bacterium]
MEQQILNKKQLLKATLVAIVLGALVLVTAVLPAEYGIDPTGVGKTLGFSKLYIENDDDTSETLTVTDENRPVIRLEKAGSGPDVAVPSEAFLPAPDTQYSERTDEVTVTVPAGKGIEYKINVLKYGKVKYEWLTNSGVLYFDFHGEVKQKIKPEQVYFESYTIAYSNNMVGTFLAPFEGKHGWYFRNSSDKDITVNLRLKGQYVL